MGVPGRSNLDSALSTIDLTTLTPVVRSSLDGPTFDVVSWTIHPLQGGMGDMGAGSSGIYRVTGQARTRGELRPWSLVLKLCTSELGSAEPSDWSYWLRECLAYQSGLLDHLPGSLAAPRCYGAVQSPDVFWLWLEDLNDELGPRWPLPRYALAARHLGQFNGAYLVGTPLPSAPWLGADWLRSLVVQAAPSIARLREPLTHPLQLRLWPADVVAALLRLWDEREVWLAALERLPQTLCHRDAFRRNLFARRLPDGREQTVAIDWAFTGIDAVGAELAPLVSGTLGFSEVAIASARTLDQLAFQGYMAGLRDAGWQGDARTARFGYTATSALTYGIGYLYTADMVHDAGWQAAHEQNPDRSFEESFDGWAGTIRFLVELAEEARGLLGSLDEV